jgi:hypothetical protein
MIEMHHLEGDSMGSEEENARACAAHLEQCKTVALEIHKKFNQDQRMAMASRLSRAMKSAGGRIPFYHALTLGEHAHVDVIESEFPEFFVAVDLATGFEFWKPGSPLAMLPVPLPGGSSGQ